jgi:putative Holliday junction resolvase
MRILGIDVGERRIGLAISDATATLARPLTTLERSGSDESAVESLRAIIDELNLEEAVGGVVVGLPKHLDGSPSEQTARAQKIAALLGKRILIPVRLQDERLSSHEAEQRLAVKERDWRKRKARLDAAAAAVILQDYLDGQGEPKGE